MSFKSKEVEEVVRRTRKRLDARGVAIPALEDFESPAPRTPSILLLSEATLDDFDGSDGHAGLPSTAQPGVTGPSGALGEDGPPFTRGATGETGPTGPTGAMGAMGATGASGIQGPMGTGGKEGEKGPMGPKEAIVRTSRGPRALVCVEGPEAWFELLLTVPYSEPMEMYAIPELFVEVCKKTSLRVVSAVSNTFQRIGVQIQGETLFVTCEPTVPSVLSFLLLGTRADSIPSRFRRRTEEERHYNNAFYESARHARV